MILNITLSLNCINNMAKIIMVDIRPSYPGGDFPFFGAIKLDRFLNILIFVEQAIDRIEIENKGDLPVFFLPASVDR